MSADATADAAASPALTEASFTELMSKFEKTIADQDKRIETLAAQPPPAGPAAAAPAAPAPEAEAPRIYTRTELNAMIAADKLTEQERDERLDLQEVYTAKEAQKSADQRQDDRADARARSASADAALSEYADVIPGLRDRSSEEYGQFTRALGVLVKDRGLPDTVDTQLLAVEKAFGPIDLHRKVEADPAKAHEEVGGEGGGDGTPKSDAKSSKPKGVTADQVIHAEHLRVTEGWDDAKVEQYYEYARKGNAQKLAAVGAS